MTSSVTDVFSLHYLRQHIDEVLIPSFSSASLASLITYQMPLPFTSVTDSIDRYAWPCDRSKVSIFSLVVCFHFDVQATHVNIEDRRSG